MACHLGFREVVINNSQIIQWKPITIDTGAAQSTLQDIKVPEYGGCYMYKNQSANTQNRYILWRVCHDVVEIWEESLDIDIQFSHVQLRYTDTPILEGLSIHEVNQRVVILLATVSSIHRICLPHPSSNANGQPEHSIFRDLSYHTLREYHNHHVINNNLTGEGLPHTAGTHLVSSGVGKGDAMFVLGQSGGALLVASMSSLPYSVHFFTIKTASLINRFFTGFVPTMFRGMEGGETVSSVVVEEFNGEVLVFGMCLDGRVRVWAPVKGECVLVQRALENTAEGGEKLTPGADRHLIRSHSSGASLYLSVFLSFAEKQMLIVFKPKISMGQLTLQLIKTLYPPQYDLIDMMITSSYIWSLWTDPKNETKLLYSPIAYTAPSSGGEGPSPPSPSPPGLTPAFLSPSPPKEPPPTDPSIDPSEAYLNELLAPNRFSAHTLNKALGIYRRSVDPSKACIEERAESGATGLWRLAEEVEAAMKDEVEMHVAEDMSEEEVEEVKVNAWATFYSHTLQYHEVAKKAVSLVSVGVNGLVGVMRKRSSISWLRPLDALELLLLPGAPPPTPSLGAALSSTPILNVGGVVALARPLRSMRAAIEPHVGAAFSHDLLHAHTPDQVAGGIATALLSVSGDAESSLDEPLSRVITSQVSGVPGLIPGFEAYLRSLQLDLGNPDALTLDPQNGASPGGGSAPWLAGAMSSRLGSAIIGAVVTQLAEHRFQLCRDLLLLQHILLQLNILSPDTKNQVYSTLLPQTTLLTQAYFALSRVCTARATLPTPSNLETSRRQMAALSLSDAGAPPLSPTLLAHFPPTTLELFILSSGGTQARALVGASLEEEEKNGLSWAQMLMPLATTVAQLAWPISKCLALVEFLVWGNQHSGAQEYIRLLQPWCEWNSCSRRFLLGVSLLNEGEPRKAAQLLLSASEGVATEEYLGIKIAGGGPDTPLEEAQVQYCLKVIRLLEQSGHIALALDMAQTGIDLASSDDPGLAALYSVSFKYHLELGHHDEAFTAMMACPDQHRRRNCLRQLIITLYERKCLSSLVSYNYGSLESEVVTILENRARSADILVTNYYDLLFAFHIRKHNFKKGAWVMYECALRLNKEGLGERGLHQQAKCFLASINCLRHLPSDQAWIIKPVAGRGERGERERDEGGVPSPKGGLSELISRKKCAQMKVLEISDLEREYQLVHARLKLFKVHPSQCTQLPGGPMSPRDTMSLLVHGNLFLDAMKLCRLFQLPSDAVLEGLALTCIHADLAQDKQAQWHWLAENGVLRDTCEGAGWWSLLHQVLESEEKGQQSHLHRIVTSTLLRRGHALPAWLYDSYKKRNCGGLIWLFLCVGMVEEAARLAMTLLDALLGTGTQQMGLSNALHANSSPVWLPYNTLDHLILELKELHNKPVYKEIYCNLMKKVDKYEKELQRVSFDKLSIMAN